jgi:hypothetical protein
MRRRKKRKKMRSCCDGGLQQKGSRDVKEHSCVLRAFGSFSSFFILTLVFLIKKKIIMTT